MTTQEKPRFAQAFNRLAVATRLSVDEADDAMKRVYWDGLSDLPLEAVEDAARDLAVSSQWFPKLAEWRDKAAAAKHARVLTKALPTPREEPWREECGTCDDTGWEYFGCPGDTTCGRRYPHAAHRYVQPCACRPTNRTYQRRCAYQAQHARR